MPPATTSRAGPDTVAVPRSTPATLVPVASITRQESPCGFSLPMMERAANSNLIRLGCTTRPGPGLMTMSQPSPARSCAARSRAILGVIRQRAIDRAHDRRRKVDPRRVRERHVGICPAPRQGEGAVLRILRRMTAEGAIEHRRNRVHIGRRAGLGVLVVLLWGRV